MTRANTALIIGAGYLGTLLAARLSDAGLPVLVTARSASRLQRLRELPGCTAFSLDLEQPIAAQFAPLAAGGVELDVYCLLTPSALSAPLTRREFLRELRQLPVRRAVMTSSTAVYGDQAGGEVTAETVAQPMTVRERNLLAIEQDWLALGDAHVARLAGLYGPHRVIGVRPLQAAEALPGTPQDLLNLIQVDDAARLLIAMMESADVAAVELGSDGCPVPRGEYYAFLAALLQVSPPRFDQHPPAPRGSKACAPHSTMARINWRPVYADYRSGVRAALTVADIK